MVLRKYLAVKLIPQSRIKYLLSIRFVHNISYREGDRPKKKGQRKLYCNYKYLSEYSNEIKTEYYRYVNHPIYLLVSHADNRKKENIRHQNLWENKEGVSLL